MRRGKRKGSKASAAVSHSPPLIRYAAAPLLDGPLSIRFELLQLQPVGQEDGTNCSAEFYAALLSKFREICGRSINEVFDNTGHEHQVDPKDMLGAGIILKRDGSPLDLENSESQFAEALPWQLSLSDDLAKHWRIQGYLLGSSFYVVWLDPAHKFCGAGKRRKKR